MEKTISKGLGYDGIKINIDTTPSLVGKGLYGYTDPSGTVTLYPDAFTNKEMLVETLGHERIHIFQHKLYGPVLDDTTARLFEKAAWDSEYDWWAYFNR